MDVGECCRYTRPPPGRLSLLPPTDGTSFGAAELSVIDADGEDRWIERDGWFDYRAHSREALIERIHQYGVADLAGAGFPTGVKLQGGDKITLIITPQSANLTAWRDDRLMQDCWFTPRRLWKVFASRRIFCKPHVRYYRREDNKPQAISILRAVLADARYFVTWNPRQIPASAARKQLAPNTDGRETARFPTAGDPLILAC